MVKNPNHAKAGRLKSESPLVAPTGPTDLDLAFARIFTSAP
jgi:hypothetical protein